MASVLLQLDSGLLESSENIQKHTCMYSASHTHVQACRHSPQEDAELGVAREGQLGLMFLASEPLGSPSTDSTEYWPFRHLMGFQASIDCSPTLAKGLWDN